VDHQEVAGGQSTDPCREGWSRPSPVLKRRTHWRPRSRGGKGQQAPCSRTVIASLCQRGAVSGASGSSRRRCLRGSWGSFSCWSSTPDATCADGWNSAARAAACENLLGSLDTRASGVGSVTTAEPIERLANESGSGFSGNVGGKFRVRQTQPHRPDRGEGSGDRSAERHHVIPNFGYGLAALIGCLSRRGESGHSSVISHHPSTAPGRESCWGAFQSLSQHRHATGGESAARELFVRARCRGLSTLYIEQPEERLILKQSHLRPAHDVWDTHPTVPGGRQPLEHPQGDRNCFTTAGGPFGYRRDPSGSPISVCAPGYAKGRSPHEEVQASMRTIDALSSPESGPDRHGLQPLSG